MFQPQRRYVELRCFDNLLSIVLGPLSQPYLSSIDLLEEKIIIRNPSLYQSISLKGYYITDHKKNHRYLFPDDCTITSNSEITLLCCPNNKIHNIQDDRLPRPNVLLWRNRDGSLRQAEVLHNDFDTVYLHDCNNVLLSSCSQWRNHPPTSSRSCVLDSGVMYTLRLVLCSLRIYLVLAALLYCHSSPQQLPTYYWIAFAIDCLTRYSLVYIQYFISTSSHFTTLLLQITADRDGGRQRLAGHRGFEFRGRFDAHCHAVHIRAAPLAR
jgi:hypothetical protein